MDTWSQQLPLARRQPNFLPAMVASGVLVAGVVGVLLAVLAYPLYEQWWLNYGNISVQTKYGEIIRGWSRGPTPLWLLGNLFWLYALCAGCLVMVATARYVMPALEVATREIEHF